MILHQVQGISARYEALPNGDSLKSAIKQAGLGTPSLVADVGLVWTCHLLFVLALEIHKSSIQYHQFNRDGP